MVAAASAHIDIAGVMADDGTRLQSYALRRTDREPADREADCTVRASVRIIKVRWDAAVICRRSAARPKAAGELHLRWLARRRPPPPTFLQTAAASIPLRCGRKREPCRSISVKVMPIRARLHASDASSLQIVHIRACMVDIPAPEHSNRDRAVLVELHRIKYNALHLKTRTRRSQTARG